MVNHFFKMDFQEDKKFIFTIFDDTDDAFYESVKPIYDLLNDNGLKTTKSIWVYPVKDVEESKGHSLKDDIYKQFIIDLKNNGFEIALHGVGSGGYKRREIKNGIEEFKNEIGYYPKIHVNHSYNLDNIYCGSKRFSFPFNYLVKKLYSKYDNFLGDVLSSEYFWGDIHKNKILYSRNYEIDDINTFKKNNYMPYIDSKYDKYANYWFSSTFAPNPWIYKRLINKQSIDRLDKENGVCVLYTHLGYYFKNGKIDSHFKQTIEYLGKKRNVLFLTVSETLDLLLKKTKGQHIPFWFKKYIELHSLKTRIKYRYLIKQDDFHFKQSKIYNQNIYTP